MAKTKLQIKLESGVPIPVTHRPPRVPKYPFSSMEVDKNNTFFIAGGKANTIHSAITRYINSDEGKGRKFSIRNMVEIIPGEEDKGEQAGVRVWRTV